MPQEVIFTLQQRSSIIHEALKKQQQRKNQSILESKKVRRNLKIRTKARTKVIQVAQMMMQHQEALVAQMAVRSQAVLGAVSVTKRRAVNHQRNRIEGNKNKKRQTFGIKMSAGRSELRKLSNTKLLSKTCSKTTNSSGRFQVN